MGVTYDHYRFKINLHNDEKYPFNLSAWQDIYLNPHHYSSAAGEISYRLEIPEDDIWDLEFVSE